MARARYKGGRYAADMAVYARLMSEDAETSNSDEISRLRENLSMAMRQEVTKTQRLYIRLYYVDGLNMVEIGEQFGVDKSTVSRTIRRGEANLRRCLRFGAASLLEQIGVSTPYRTVERRAKREGYENMRKEK